jgi:hypothetical protein
MGLTELVVGLEVPQSLVKISFWITSQPTGLLSWLHGRFGMRTTPWLKKKGVCVRDSICIMPRDRSCNEVNSERSVFGLSQLS